MTEHATTNLLDIAYESGGPADGHPVLMLHGWPDDVRTFDGMLDTLHGAGFRTFRPRLRGFGETRFLSSGTMRSGQIAAMTKDAFDLADALGLEDFAIVGHDWGARIAYLAALAAPKRVKRIVALSVGWKPGKLPTPPLEQARAFWYQWFLTTARGAEKVRADPKAFARIQWETWSPPGWFGDADFEETARAFENPDWADITIHSYSVRWQEAETDPRYADLETLQQDARTVDVPTLMIQGGEDRVVLPQTTEGEAGNFTAGYRRKVLPGVGHFPTREAPDEVAGLVVDFLGEAI